MLGDFEHEIAALSMARKAGAKKSVAKLEAKIGTAELPDGLALYANAYINLDSERGWGEPIPWSKCVAYGHEYGFSDRQIEDLIDYTRAIDRVVLKKREADAKRNAARPS